MQLQDIFDQLRYSELQHIKLGGHRDGTGITSEDYPAIVTHINLALTDLHTRFPIRKETVYVQIHENISTYFLNSDYAESNTGSSQPVKYIKDTTSDPFNDNLTRIEEIADELGNPYALNVENDCESITLPIHNAFNFPNPVNDLTVKVSYRANHPKLENVNGSTIVDIPMALLPVMLLYIKHRIYASLPSLSGVQASQQALQDYMLQVQEIEDAGVINSETSINEKREAESWV